MNYTTCVLWAHLDDLVSMLSHVAQRANNIDSFTNDQVGGLEKDIDIITPVIIRLRNQFQYMPTNKIDREYES